MRNNRKTAKSSAEERPYKLIEGNSRKHEVFRQRRKTLM